MSFFCLSFLKNSSIKSFLTVLFDIEHECNLDCYFSTLFRFLTIFGYAKLISEEFADQNFWWLPCVILRMYIHKVRERDNSDREIQRYGIKCRFRSSAYTLIIRKLDGQFHIYLEQKSSYIEIFTLQNWTERPRE